MKKFFLALFMGAMLLVSSIAFADFTVPTPTGYVTDTTGKLSTAQVSQLNQRLTDYQRSTKNEIAVLMVPSLGGADLSDATHQVFKTYRVGKAGLDNGVVLFIAVNDHKMRLQTGSGIEGEITDIQANDILTSMKPSFRAGNFYAGISTALDQIQAKLDNRTGQKVDPGKGQQFNAPVPQVADSNATTKTNQADCSVGSDVGNAAGWGFGLLALFVAAIAFARRFVRKNEERKMAETEAKVDAVIAAEKAAAAVKAERARIKAAAQPILPVPTPVIQVPIAASTTRSFDEPPVRLAKHDEAAEEQRAQARREREAAERAEVARAEARRERLREEERAEARRREREEAEEDTSSVVAAVAAVEILSSIFDDSSSSGSSGSDSGFDWGGSDSGFGGGDSGGGGSDSDW